MKKFKLPSPAHQFLGVMIVGTAALAITAMSINPKVKEEASIELLVRDCEKQGLTHCECKALFDRAARYQGGTQISPPVPVPQSYTGADIISSLDTRI